MSDIGANPKSINALLQRKDLRCAIHNNEPWFVIADVIVALTDSVDPKSYIKTMRRRDSDFAKAWGNIHRLIPFATAGGIQNIKCANTDGVFRIVQFIPSPKAKPFKRWLATRGVIAKRKAAAKSLPA